MRTLTFPIAWAWRWYWRDGFLQTTLASLTVVAFSLLAAGLGVWACCTYP